MSNGSSDEFTPASVNGKTILNRVPVVLVSLPISGE